VGGFHGRLPHILREEHGQMVFCPGADESMKRKEITGRLINLHRGASIASVVWWSEFLATDPEDQVLFLALPHFLRSSGPGTWSTKPLSTTEELLGRKIAAPV
jgi:hypothetical protein